MSWLASVRERVIGNPRSTVLALLLAALAALLWAGAGAIAALTAEVTALGVLAQALADGWHAWAVAPLGAWLLLKKDPPA